MQKIYDSDSAEDILEQWSTYRNRLLDAVKKIDENNFSKSPAGGWSAAEICEHLYHSQFQLARGILPALRGRIKVDPQTLSQEKKDEILSAFEKPMGAQNPDVNTPRHNWSKTDAISKLSEAEEKLLKNSAGHAVSTMKQTGLPHEFFGNLSLFDYLWIMAEHERMHTDALYAKYKLD